MEKGEIKEQKRSGMQGGEEQGGEDNRGKG